MMVNLHFPSQLTEEEQMLKKKYEQLRRKKIALQNLNSPKQEPPLPKPLVKPGTLKPKKDAKEVAKILLKTGAIGAIKVENKGRQGFKRSEGLERKRNACKNTTSSVTGYQPFSASHISGEDPMDAAEAPSDPKISPSCDSRPPLRKLCKSFASFANLDEEGQTKETPACREPDRDSCPERPRQGNTVYVRGVGITEEILQKTFKLVGNIINITLEKKCGFVTFEKIEEAERAIKEVDGCMKGEVYLNVSLARRQPLIQPLKEDSPFLAWGSSVNYPVKASHGESRELVVYDDMV